MTPARGWSPRAAACALVVGVALASGSASAQPQLGGSPAMAEALFQQARELFKQERYAEACPKFAESQRLEPKLGTLLNLAVCHEKTGKIATAWAEYTSAATIARRDGSKEREDFAREQVATLEKKLARVVVQVDAAAGPSVTLDDQPLDRTALNTPLPVDPGKHRIGAAAPGKVAWSTVIEAPPERAELTVPVPALEAAVEPPQPAVAPLPAPPAATASAPAPGGPLAPTAQKSAPEPAHAGSMALAYTGFGVGTAGVLVGAVAGGFALAQAGSIREHCSGTRCDADQAKPLSSATLVANVANVGFTVGAIGLVFGVAGLFVARTSAPAPAPVPRAAVTLTPIVGPGAAGLRGSF